MRLTAIVLVVFLGCAGGGPAVDGAPDGAVGVDVGAVDGRLDSRPEGGTVNPVDLAADHADAPPPSPDAMMSMMPDASPDTTPAGPGPCPCGGGWPNDAGQCTDPCAAADPFMCCCGFRNQCQTRATIAECCRR